jgi:mono/diheme cytochrome c family protein
MKELRIVAFRSAKAALFLLATCYASVAFAADNDPAALPPAIQTFLKEQCYECHGPDEQESGLRYDRLTRYSAADTHLWTMVHQKLSAGEMPPKDSAQPLAAEKEKLLKWIETQQRAAAASSLRRLNRRELAAALSDVTGLAVDYTPGLPGDGKVAGLTRALTG